MSAMQSPSSKPETNADVSKSIQRYITNDLSLAQKDISEAANSREWALKLIKNKIDSRIGSPVLYSETPFLYFGSYPKKTKVKEVDEFDILVVIDSNEGYFNTWWGMTKGTGLGSASPNHIFSSELSKPYGQGVSPRKLLDWLQDIVKEALDPFGVEFPTQDGPSLTVYLKSVDLRLDLVPAAIFKRPNGDIFYTILTDEDSWLETAPHIDIIRLETVADSKDNFRNVVRIAKRIKDTYGFDVSSFAIETAIVDYAEANDWANDLILDVCRALNYLSARFDAGAIYDPIETSRNLIGSSENLSTAKQQLIDIIGELIRCVALTDQAESDLRVEMAFENK